ncbi:MAG TPA: pepsin/retropepsin-like aspartic protease family protein [Candidatus Rubrimentiphilum sp.]|nr:pepsin/retropepsin-like aspartic protease family protein [Candidatus Rubrimentiphilum sp.]
MRLRIAIVAAVLALLPPAALGQDNTIAPFGIRPTAMSLGRLLKLHAAAVGKLAPGMQKTRIESWSYKDGGLNGTVSVLIHGDDQRIDTQLAPFHFASGTYRGQDWEQNENGQTHLVSGVHQRDAVDRKALAQPSAFAGGVTLLGEVSTPKPAYVVRVAPPGGRVAYLFYDRANFLIVRTERAVRQDRIVTTYDDFRTTSGRTEAWHIQTSNGKPEDDTDSQLQSLQVGVAIDPAKFAIPRDAQSPASFSATRLSLPVTIDADRIILKTQIQGRKVDFQLDSGASGILLDRSIAEALKIPLYGKLSEVTTGEYKVSRAIVPAITFGGVSLDNIAVETAPFHWYTSDGTPIAGLMGYDFLDSCVVHIDYIDGTVEALAPSSFAPPAGAIALPVRLDDMVPAISAQIGSSVGENFVLDTGADRSLLFSEFVNAHPHDTLDQGLGEEITDSFPFVEQSSGVGGDISIRPVQVSGLDLGRLHFSRWLFHVTEQPNSFNQEDYDGLIGQDVLRNFDVYLDYAHSTIYLVPNDRYRQRWGS